MGGKTSCCLKYGEYERRLKHGMAFCDKRAVLAEV